MIAISCPGFCMTPFKEMLEAIAQHFDSWEIVAEGMHDMHDIKDHIREAKNSYKIEFTVHAPFSDLNIASLNPQIRENSLAQIIDAIRICNDLDIKLLTIHPGHKSPLGAYFLEKIKDTNKKSLIQIDKAGEEYGIVLALENIPKMWVSLCSDAQEMRELIDGTNLKICFDVGHAHISDAVPGFLKLKRDFVNLHLHDNNGDKDKHLVLGEGNIALEEILSELKEYKGNFVIESTSLKDGIKSKTILESIFNNI
jgi:sugar phosphate isomerase/epimerase